MISVTKKTSLTVGAALIILSFATYEIVSAPDNTYDPFCTYTSQYSLEAKLKVGNEILSSTISRQRSISRDWILTINQAGCKQTYGKALSFKSSDNRVFLISTNICPIAEEVLLELGEVDFLQLCTDKIALTPSGFIVTDADNPSWWQPFNPLTSNIGILLSMKAIETDNHPSDSLEQLAPNILRTSFETGGNWWRSPERLLSGRRSSTGMTYKAQKILGSK